MIKITQKRFADFFRAHPETGTGYCIATARLKDGREYRQVVINSGYVSQIRGYSDIPFVEEEIDYFVVTHDKWDFVK